MLLKNIRMENLFCPVVLLLGVFIMLPAAGGAEIAFNEMTANSSKPVLNLASYALDDKYKGCMNAMKSNLKSLLKMELATSQTYKATWEEALKEWKKEKDSKSLPRNITDFAEVAILTYTSEVPKIYKEFNTATQTAGKGPKEYEAYPFKSLHFLLTWAAKAFQSMQPKCINVYRGTNVKFSIKKMFRFGQFTSTSEDKKVASRFGKATFFELFTCKGYSINERSMFKYEDEVLIPPYELFQVVSVNNTEKGKTIKVKSRGSCSNHNCAFVGKGWNGTTTCPDHQVLYL
ncbi:erythroblast NAD(P)(+)--arginine ADP-ribosyltransferase-like [Heteronotia binoei]|uniref:erythroblast NAD(P)(+)--arginine ADP-ribosyltransferase-like n=1 Tax=Heteronotia binoei TaxID=13085 RepID=UPI00292FAADB|nr:erythroblast NAD(P)(+)--arginine ADP-ribosyltransferase-like [Heteronotia binoei]